MLQLSKKLEYGLIALRHMAMQRRGQVFTAKELAEAYDIPYELLAKILQKLTRAGIVSSTQGVKGGYALLAKPESLTIGRVISIIEDEKPMITECYAEGADSCSIFGVCTIRRPLGKIQHNIDTLFDTMTLQQIL